MAGRSFTSHDANARNSKKMLNMRSQNDGMKAAAIYGVYWMLVETLRESENYEYPTNYRALAFDFRVDEALVKEVVEDYGFFDLSEDRSTFRSHGLDERMDIMDSKSAAGRKGAEARWGKKDENGSEMAQNGTSMRCQCDTEWQTDSANANKLNKNKINNTSSSLPSSPSDEGVSKEEQEQEKIVYYFTFQRNWAAPNKEYEELVEYNSGPQQKRKWHELTEPEKKAILAKWRQEPQRPKRFDDTFLHTWQKVYEALVPVAPYQVRMGLLDDEVGYYIKDRSFFLKVPRCVQPSIEGNLDRIKRWLWPFIQKCGCEMMTYSLY